MLKRIKEIIGNHVLDKYLFDINLQEKINRQAFYYNAFQALAYNGIDGDYAEFGCFHGMTFTLAYHESRRHRHKAKFWAFDSFQGLPASKEEADQHPHWHEGAMSTSLEQFHKICKSNGIPRSDYNVVPGFYNQTLKMMSPADEPKNIALAFLDCDLYSSTKTVLEFLLPRLKHGMIIAFDDYFCWSASQIAGERRVKMQFSSNNDKWGLIPYMRFGWAGHSFVVERRDISP